MTDFPAFLPGNRNTLPEEPTSAAKPGFLDIIKPAFERENIIGSGKVAADDEKELRQIQPEGLGVLGPLTVQDEDFDPFDSLIDTPYESYATAFVGADTDEEVALIKGQLDRELGRQAEIEAAGTFTGFMANLAAAATSPETFIPIGGQTVRGLKTGSSIVRNARNVAVAGAAGAAVSEAALQQQDTRSQQETVLNILGGAAFGGVLGGGAGVLARGRGTLKNPYSQIYNDDAWTGVKVDADEMMTFGNSSVGAAQNKALPVAMERMVGSKGVAEFVAGLGPQTRVLVRSGSASAMRAMSSLAESAFVFKKNTHGIATAPGGAVETAGKRIMGDVVGVEDKIADLFSEYRLGEARSFRGDLKLAGQDLRGPADGFLKRNEFAEQITIAMERGEHEIPQVQAAAQEMRKLMDDLGKQAEEAGLIVEGLVGKKQKNGSYYTPIIYQRKAIRANRTNASGTGFEDRVAQDFQQKAGEVQDEMDRLYDERATLEGSQADQNADLPDDKALNNIRRYGRKEPEKYPVLNMLKAMGGIDPRSPLAGELRAMGVSSRTNIGLFRNKGTVKDVDNFVQDEIELFQDLPRTEDGYVDRNTILDLISDEMGGNPLVPRSVEQDVADNFKAEYNRMVEDGIDFSGSNRSVRDQIMSNRKRQERDEDGNLIEAPVIEEGGSPAGNPMDDADYRASLDEQGGSFGADSANRLKEIDELLEELARYADAHDPAVARDLAIESVNKILGLTDADIYRPPTPGKAGVFKERLLNIDPNLIREFTQQNSINIQRRYARVVSTDVAMVKKYGDVEMSRPIAEIKEDFAAMRRKLVSDQIKTMMKEGGPLASLRDTPEGIKQLNTLMQGVNKFEDVPAGPVREALEAAPSLAKKMAEIGKREEDTLRDLTTVRDRIRGQFDNPDDPDSIWNRTEQGLLGLNYMRLLGGMVISAFPDLAMGIFRNGLNRNLKVHMRLMSSAASYKGSRQEMRLLGVGTEMAMDSRLSALTEFEPGSGAAGKLGQAADTAMRTFGKVTLMTPWNAALKQMNGVVFGNFVVEASRKVRDGTATQKQITELASWNIDTQLAKEIADQIDAHAPKYDDELMLGLGSWSNKQAAEEFRNALITQVDKTIITPGQEKPTWMSRRGWRLMGQFKSFGMASTQMILVSGMQRRNAEQLSGIISLIALGTVTYGIKEKEAGRELPPVDLAHSGEWLKNGIDRSGVTGILFDINNMVEKTTDGAVGVSRLTGGGQVSRYRSRNKLGALLGPSAGTVEDILKLSGDAANGDWTAGSTARMRRLAPFQNAIGIRKIFDEFENGMNAALGVPPKEPAKK